MEVASKIPTDFSRSHVFILRKILFEIFVSLTELVF